eukprot:TRINITY_DN1738_c0_g2_i2.p1 TRINITY_DN1738_c0_g2~~TRINITY_DN1738_c0_g2_i2.p1  ORF type:complete len:174 (-),score=53.52 TRINITY_DN1738_c0_g2_i2:81-602(-)
MKIFIDVFTEEEIASDAYPIKVINDVAYEIETKLVVEGDDDFGISNNEEEGESASGGGAPKEPVNNLVNAHKLEVTSFSKKDFMTYIKGYLAKLKKRLVDVDSLDADTVKAFETGCRTFIGGVVKAFDEYTFYTGPTMNLDGQILLCKWGKNAEDVDVPFFYLLKAGIREEKC